MKTIIIAEAGVNHNGYLDLAKKLVDNAKECGADYVKFQTFKTDLLVSKVALKADYQSENTNDKVESQYDMVKKLELSYEDFTELKKYCDKCGIGFLSTGFDLPSIDFLKLLDIDYFKIPSGEITNLPLLKAIGHTGKPIIFSTGMSNMEEIREAITILVNAGAEKEKITVLHCNTEYPTPMEHVNLKAMLSIGKELLIPIGYSDHTLGIEVPVAAVALGATIIEKHFTLDKTMAGPDHKASLEPVELKAMVTAIRNIEKALGSCEKKASASEIKNIAIARKSIHLNKALKKNHQITESDLVMKRPGDGISPLKIDEIIGKKTVASFPADHKLSISDIQ